MKSWLAWAGDSNQKCIGSIRQLPRLRHMRPYRQNMRSNASTTSLRSRVRHTLFTADLRSFILLESGAAGWKCSTEPVSLLMIRGRGSGAHNPLIFVSDVPTLWLTRRCIRQLPRPCGRHHWDVHRDFHGTGRGDERHWCGRGRAAQGRHLSRTRLLSTQFKWYRQFGQI